LEEINGKSRPPEFFVVARELIQEEFKNPPCGGCSTASDDEAVEGSFDGRP
jgi:hypothetical protein